MTESSCNVLYSEYECCLQTVHDALHICRRHAARLAPLLSRASHADVHDANHDCYAMLKSFDDALFHCTRLRERQAPISISALSSSSSACAHPSSPSSSSSSSSSSAPPSYFASSAESRSMTIPWLPVMRLHHSPAEAAALVDSSAKSQSASLAVTNASDDAKSCSVPAYSSSSSSPSSSSSSSLPPALQHVSSRSSPADSSSLSQGARLHSFIQQQMRDQTLSDELKEEGARLLSEIKTFPLMRNSVFKLCCYLVVSSRPASSSFLQSEADALPREIMKQFVQDMQREIQQIEDKKKTKERSKELATERGELSHGKQRRSKSSVNNGRALELYFAILMLAMGFELTKCGGGKNDGGIDVRMVARRCDGSASDASSSTAPSTPSLSSSFSSLHLDHDMDVIASCKQYSESPLAPTVARDLMGAALRERASLSLLVSTAGFGDPCKAFATGFHPDFCSASGPCSSSSLPSSASTGFAASVPQFYLLLIDGDALATLLGTHSVFIRSFLTSCMQTIRRCIHEVSQAENISSFAVPTCCLQHTFHAPPSDAHQAAVSCYNGQEDVQEAMNVSSASSRAVTFPSALIDSPLASSASVRSSQHVLGAETLLETAQECDDSLVASFSVALRLEESKEAEGEAEVSVEGVQRRGEQDTTDIDVTEDQEEGKEQEGFHDTFTRQSSPLEADSSNRHASSSPADFDTEEIKDDEETGIAQEDDDAAHEEDAEADDEAEDFDEDLAYYEAQQLHTAEDQQGDDEELEYDVGSQSMLSAAQHQHAAVLVPTASSTFAGRLSATPLPALPSIDSLRTQPDHRSSPTPNVLVPSSSFLSSSSFSSPLCPTSSACEELCNDEMSASQLGIPGRTEALNVNFIQIPRLPEASQCQVLPRRSLQATLPNAAITSLPASNAPSILLPSPFAPADAPLPGFSSNPALTVSASSSSPAVKSLPLSSFRALNAKRLSFGDSFITESLRSSSPIIRSVASRGQNSAVANNGANLAESLLLAHDPYSLKQNHSFLDDGLSVCDTCPASSATSAHSESSSNAACAPSSTAAATFSSIRSTALASTRAPVVPPRPLILRAAPSNPSLTASAQHSSTASVSAFVVPQWRSDTSAQHHVSFDSSFVLLPESRDNSLLEENIREFDEGQENETFFVAEIKEDGVTVVKPNVVTSTSSSESMATPQRALTSALKQHATVPKLRFVTTQTNIREAFISSPCLPAASPKSASSPRMAVQKKPAAHAEESNKSLDTPNTYLRTKIRNKWTNEEKDTLFLLVLIKDIKYSSIASWNDWIDQVLDFAKAQNLDIKLGPRVSERRVLDKIKNLKRTDWPAKFEDFKKEFNIIPRAVDTETSVHRLNLKSILGEFRARDRLGMKG